MKVGLLGLEGEFDPYKDRKTRFYRFTHELYANMKGNREGIRVEKIESKLIGPIGKGLSILADTMFRDLSSFDIIHNTDLNPFFPTRKGRAKVITTAHDFQFVLAPELNKDVESRIQDKIWVGAVLKMALESTMQSDYLIAISTLTRDDAAKLGYDRKRIFVVNHGIDKRFMARVPEKRNRRFKVGYIGMLRYRKNVGLAIEAAKRLDPKKFSMEIWGNKAYGYQELAKQAEGARNIRFMGFAPDDKMVQIYDSFDAFVLPSFYEGFGIPVLEAQARGLPVILYTRGRIPEEVSRHCFMADDKDHMAQILEDLRENGYDQRKRASAMRYARSFTWQKTAEKTLEVYKKVYSARD